MNHEQRNRIEKKVNDCCWIMMDEEVTWCKFIFGTLLNRVLCFLGKKYYKQKDSFMASPFCFLSILSFAVTFFFKREIERGKVDKREKGSRRESRREFGSRNTWWSSKHTVCRCCLIHILGTERDTPASLLALAIIFHSVETRATRREREVVRIVFHDAQLRVQDTPCHSICSESTA